MNHVPLNAYKMNAYTMSPLRVKKVFLKREFTGKIKAVLIKVGSRPTSLKGKVFHQANFY